MREILAVWLIEVYKKNCNFYFNFYWFKQSDLLELHYQIKHLSICYSDIYLSINAIEIDKLQLLGATSLNLALKVFKIAGNFKIKKKKKVCKWILFLEIWDWKNLRGTLLCKRIWRDGRETAARTQMENVLCSSLWLLWLFSVLFSVCFAWKCATRSHRHIRFLSWKLFFSLYLL